MHETSREKIRTHALELGFDAVGFARADVALDEDFARWEAFVGQGMHGAMEWLAAHRDARLRLDSDAILGGARTVVCVAQRCAVRTRESAPRSLHDPVVTRIARYARGRDYHNHLKKKLQRLAGFVESVSPGVRARALCDTAPVFERALAARAGVGFVGKNGMLIRPGMGSHLLLGEVVTTLPLEPDAPMERRCGDCTRCIEACPTKAFVAPWILDPRRCVSYLTIEQRGAWEPGLEPLAGRALFGCDACQEACPFNAARGAFVDGDSPYEPLAQWREASVASLLRASDAELEAITQGSPLRRAGVEGLRRNLIVVASNLGDPSAAPLLAESAARLQSAWLRDVALRSLGRVSR